jgi:hypothetical protein
MVTTKFEGVPGQLLNVGVTVTVPTIVPGVLLFVFVGAVQGAICPLPETGMPICALLFDQAKLAPIGFETNVGGVMVAPGHTVMGLNGPTVATG